MVKLPGIKRSLKWQHAETIRVEIQFAFMSYMSPTSGITRPSSLQKKQNGNFVYSLKNKVTLPKIV